MTKRYLYSFFAIVLTNLIFSQSSNQAIANGDEPNVLYRNEMYGKVFLHGRGLGINFTRGKHVTATRKRLFEIDALNLKHPKEIKTSFSQNNLKRFVYGKLNNVLLFRVGIGNQITIYKRADRKSVEIRTSYFIGANLTFAKPTYVLVYRQDFFGQKTQVSKKYDPDVYSIDSIAGKGNFFDGVSSTKIYPGFYAKINLSFEYAPLTYKIKAIETGIVLDYYPNALPIMARNPKENFVVTLYVGFVFGKRWF